MMLKVFGWVLVAGFLTVGGLILATRWALTHPPACNAACKAQRDAQWRRMAN
jgi:hypothetical protein